MEPQKFSIAVDSDHKATEFRLLSLSSPHMRAFHLAWLSLFTCFFSTFSIPPLLPIIRQDLNLSPSDVGTAGIAAFAGSIVSRLAMGPACDLFGPRLASTILSLATAPVLLSALFISTPLQFIFLRFLVGFSLANFVANQFWMSSMFSSCTVGLANGVAAGWANVGSGLTQLVMPIIYSILNTNFNLTESVSWRTALVVPAIFQVVMALMVLAYGQDLPDGTYINIKKPKNSSKDSAIGVFFNGITNYRGWVLGLTYGYCFGVELTMDNIIAEYFYDRFGVNMETAGVIAASFGFANWVSRPTGGVVSDKLGKRFGVKGRLWGLWVVQTVAGLMCLWLGQINGSDIRDDRERRDGGCSGHTIATVFRFNQNIHTNWDFSYGCYDDNFKSFTHNHLLPSMGWHVMWPFFPPPILPIASLINY
ncbi:hypothetical protein E3N88_02688 [Mikania micrantha]|uniref:Major facilitator superfamily (MFS) profile domain-containing protein n=1 Tax=Mikania micrantha TaxID=192012 RepID=A0A5N6Q4P4_9ASTR|nr:hypothetical protein E3N88_02688 [Mikania micrantha]